MKPVEDCREQSGASARYSVTDLGTLGGQYSSAVAINDEGKITGNSDTHDRGSGRDVIRHAFLWKKGRIQDLGDFKAAGINRRGQVIGVHYLRGNLLDSYAVVYNAHKVSRLLPKSSGTSFATGINDQDEIVGGTTKWDLSAKPPTVQRCAYVWKNGRVDYLDIPTSYEAGENFSINNRGQVAGSIRSIANESHKSQATLWTNGERSDLGTLEGLEQSQAIGINNQGDILGQSFHSTIEELVRSLYRGVQVAEQDKSLVFYQRAFFWHAGQLRELGVLENDPSQSKNNIARAFNDRGEVVGTSGCEFVTSGGKVPHAFLFKNGRMLDLNSLIVPNSPWTLTDATGINNRGQIVGTGRYNGLTRAFLLTRSNE